MYIERKILRNDRPLIVVAHYLIILMSNNVIPSTAFIRCEKPGYYDDQTFEIKLADTCSSLWYVHMQSLMSASFYK